MHQSRKLWKSAAFTSSLALLLFLANALPLLRHVLLPLEDYLLTLRLSQPEMNSVFILICLLFTLFVGGSAIIAHYLVQGKERHPLAACLMLLSSALLAGYGIEQLYRQATPKQLAVPGIDLKQQRLNYGPYPTEPVLAELRRGGVTQIISLLDPRIPFEAARLQAERESASKLGLSVHSLPLLSYVQDNSASLQAISQLLKSHPGDSFYVHSHLGQVRSELVRRFLADQEIDTRLGDIPWPSGFERGQIHSFDHGRIAIGPQPTDQEWAELTRRRVSVIIALLDQQDPEQAARIAEVEALAQTSGVKLLVITLPLTDPFALANDIVALLATNLEKYYVFDYAHGDRILAVAQACSLSLQQP